MQLHNEEYSSNSDFSTTTSNFVYSKCVINRNDSESSMMSMILESSPCRTNDSSSKASSHSIADSAVKLSNHFLCRCCSKYFTREDNLQRHNFIMHSSKIGQLFKCSICSLNFSRKDSLLRHNNRENV